MSYLILLDVAKARQAETIREVERERMVNMVLRATERPSVLRKIVRTLRRE
jgi:hypothetical protein